MRFTTLQAVLTGNYIVAVCLREVARLGNLDIFACVTQTFEDVVRGEVMQLSNKGQSPEQRFSSYLEKTYLKTASLLANGCKAVSSAKMPKNKLLWKILLVIRLLF